MTELTRGDVLDAVLPIAERIPTPRDKNPITLPPLREVLDYDRRPQASATEIGRVGSDFGLIPSSSQLDEREGLPRPIAGMLVRPSNGGTLEVLAQQLSIGYAAASTRSCASDHHEAIPADNGDSHLAGQPGAPTQDPQ